MTTLWTLILVALGLVKAVGFGKSSSAGRSSHPSSVARETTPAVGNGNVLPGGRLLRTPSLLGNRRGAHGTGRIGRGRGHCQSPLRRRHK